MGAIFAGVFYYRDMGPSNTNIANINTAANTNAGIVLGSQTKIKKFANYDELKEFLAQAPESGSGITMVRAAVGLIDPTMSDTNLGETANTAGLSQKSLQAGEDYSTTNVQVAGVDEADIIKTDGKYIYAVSGKSIFITGDRSSEYNFQLNCPPQNLYLNGDSRLS